MKVVIIGSIKCPYCGFEGELKLLKTWKFRFYDVKRFQCPKCMRMFNYYYGINPRIGKVSEFVIKR